MRRLAGLISGLTLIALMFIMTLAPVYARPQEQKDKNWNLAHKQPVKASGYDKGFLPELAVDGLYDPYLTPPECWRRSGEAPNWIEVEFAGKALIERVDLLVGRGAPAVNVDLLARLPDGKLAKLGAFTGEPDANGMASIDLPKPPDGVTGVRIGMLDPGFPCIFELGVNGRIPDVTPPDIPTMACMAAPDVIYHSGTVVTMDPDLPTAEAVAIFGRWVDAVGSTQEILRLANACTQEIDLGGRTVMPGFIDAHAHVLEIADLGATMEERQDVLLRNGVTSIGHLHTSPEALEAISAFDAEGKLKVRTGLYLVYNGNCNEPYGFWFMDHPPTREFGEMLRINGVKMFADGTAVTGCDARPFFSVPFFPDTPENPDPLEPYGDQFLTSAEIANVTAMAQSIGHQVAIHVVGDAAVENALDGIEAALGGSANTFRHRIEHNSVIRPDQYTRYGEIGIVATIPSTYLICDPLGPPLPDEYLSWEWPYRALVDANGSAGRFAWQADAPLHPQNPFYALYGFVTQKDLDATGTVCTAAPPYTNPPSWIDDNDFSVDEALRFMTIDAAYALFRETEVGSLEVGKLADLVVVTGDPRVMEPDAFKDIRVLVTMVGGRTRFCADPAAGLCP